MKDLKYTVAIDNYGHTRSEMYHFYKLSEAVEFIRQMKKVKKRAYICMFFYV